MTSLRNRLLLLVALSLGPGVLLALHNGQRERERAVVAAKSTLQQITNLAAINEERSISQAQQLLLDLSHAPELLEEYDDCNRLMRKALARNPQYVNLGLIQLNGDVTCSAVRSPKLVNLGDRRHFTEAVAGRRFVVGGYVFGRVVQKHTINLTHPVIDASGAVVAVVFAALDLGALDAFISGVTLPAGAILLTLDRDGVIVSRQPAPQDWLGKTAEAPLMQALRDPSRQARELEGPDGMRRLHAFSEVGTPHAANLVLTIGVPAGQIIEAAVRQQLVTSVTLAVTALLALLAAWYAGEYLIVRRVQALARTAGRIAGGDLAARTGVAYGREELGDLARAIDDMAGSLQQQTAQRDRAEAAARQAHEELTQTDLRKDEFLAMLAHELRNPLAPIRNAAHLLQMTQVDVARARAAGALIARQVDHMTELVDDLLDVSRVTRGLVTLDLRPVDLNAIARDAVEQAQPIVQARGHALDVRLHGDPMIVQGDATRLIQVTANVLNNAAKYTPEGGNLALTVSLVDGWGEVAVRDDGIGIAPELLPHVFELFSQADRTPDRAQGGLGLGLALVKGLVELHGGNVRAHSDGAGTGSTFTIRLPAAAGTVSALQAAHEAGTQPAAQRSLRVLIVDDNADAADTTATCLEAMGWQVAVEYSAAAALVRAADFRPGVCLLDIGLPEMDGHQLARELLVLPQTRTSVMVALTGYGQQQDRARSTQAGFAHHLVKPVTLHALAALLEAVEAERAMGE